MDLMLIPSGLMIVIYHALAVVSALSWAFLLLSCFFEQVSLLPQAGSLGLLLLPWLVWAFTLFTSGYYPGAVFI